MSQKLKTLKYVLGRAGWGGMTHTLENTKKKKIHIKNINVNIRKNMCRELAERTEHHEK